MNSQLAALVLIHSHKLMINMQLAIVQDYPLGRVFMHIQASGFVATVLRLLGIVSYILRRLLSSHSRTQYTPGRCLVLTASGLAVLQTVRVKILPSQ